MAIAKVQFKSSASATPQVWMDVTQKTVNAANLALGETALKNDGTDIIGALAASGLEYETGTYMPTSDVARPTIYFTNTHSNPPIWVLFVDSSESFISTSNSNIMFDFYDAYRLNGIGHQNASSYDSSLVSWRFFQTTSASSGILAITYNSDNTTASSNTYSRYWVDVDKFMPYSNTSSRYWRSGRTYKWIAVWAPTI